MMLLKLLATTLMVLCVKGDVVIEPSTAAPGEDVTINCEIIIRPGKTVQWYKYQESATNADVLGYNDIISNGDYKERCTTEIAYEGERTIFTIHISGIRYEDSGYYRCGVMGEADTETESELVVTHGLESLKMLSGDTELEHNQLLHVTEGDRYPIKCEAKGSNPAPHVTITFDSDNLDEHFDNDLSAYWEDAGLGENMKYKKHEVIRTSNNELLVSTKSNRKALTCTASVPGYEDMSITVRPVLQSPTEAHCDHSVVAGMDNKDVVLQCTVEADPDPSEMHWSWTSPDGQEIQLSPGETSMNNYYADKHQMVDGRYNFTLTIQRTYGHSFNNYTMFAKNDIGSDSDTITLQYDQKMDALLNGVPKIFFSMGLIFITVFLAIFHNL